MKRILLTALALLSFGQAADRPNIVLILTDNHGAWTLGCYGNEDIRTPHLDKLAMEGTLFSQAYAVNPVCSPTRASILTGLMPSQHGLATPTDVPFMMGPKAFNLLEEFASLPEVLKANGYNCGLSGKWHLGDNLHPQEGLEDLWVTMPVGSTSTFYGAKIIENGEVRTEPQYMTDLWTDRAVGFIEKQAEGEKPFFLYLAYNGPYGLSRLLLEPSRNRHHDYYANHPLPSFPRVATRPWQFPNREYVNNLDAFRRYAAEVSGVDDGVGRVLQAIRDSGVEEDTIVVFTGDQGLGSGHNNLWGMGDHTRPLHLFDSTLRIPMIVRIPGTKAKGARVDELVSQVDLFPTLLSLAGLEDKIPTDNPLAGRDLSAVLKGEGKADSDRAVFADYENTRSIRTKNWKLIERFDDNGKLDDMIAHDELYHLQNDPGETENLYSDPSSQAKRDELKNKLKEFFSIHNLPKHDMWNGGESQTHNIVMGDHAAERYKRMTEELGYPLNPYDVNFIPPPMTIPDGYAVETAAAPPLVNHPVAGCLDDRGRLFLCENTGDNLVAGELETRMQNRVTMLTDTNRDGLFDKSETFAEGFTFPQGVLWHDGALYVASPPSIWKLEDTDDDGKADKRSEIATGFGYNGNAASVHTPRLSPTGRLFWGHGRKQSSVKNIEGEVVHEGNTARIWTARPDGSDLRSFCGGGFANPVELDFWKTGEVIGNVNILLRNPNRSDCLVHWQHGGVYPRHNDGNMLEEFTQTGPLLNEFVNFGHVAVSGLTRYRSGELSPSPEDDWTDNFFMTLFNSQELVRLKIERDGSGFRSVTHPFLTIHDPGVHLVGVLEDADGSLLLIDTGGWFRQGCPQSGFAKPDIAGAIYRIRKAGVYDRKTDWRGEGIDWKDAGAAHLCALLSDPGFTVRQRASEELAKRDEDALPALAQLLETHPDSDTRIRAVFALGRTETSKSNSVLRNALRDREPEVRIAAAQAVGERGDKASVPALLKNLHHASKALQRETAVALGRTGSPLAVPDLVSALSSEYLDRPREHALIRALLDIGDQPAIAEAFSESLAVFRGLSEFSRRRLIVMNGLDSDSLAASDLVPHLLSRNDQLREQAIELFLDRPAWASKARPALQKYLKDRSPDLAATVKKLLANGLKELPNSITAYLKHDDTDVRNLALQALADSRGIEAHPDWIEPLRKMLNSENTNVLAAVASFEPQPFLEEIRAIAEDESRTNLVRVQALGIADSDRKTFSDEAFDLLESILDDPTNPSSERLQASMLLAGETRLQATHRLRAAKLLVKAGPLEFPILFTRIVPVQDDLEIGAAIAEAYLHAPGAHAVPPGERKRLLIARYEPEFWKEPVAELEKQIAAERNVARRIDRLESLVAGGIGDASRGKAIALAEKTACVVCHRIGGKGTHVGPDLSSIGQIRKPADLLESIILPSASLAQDYEAYTVELKNGEIVMGVLKNESSESVEVALLTGEIRVIPRDQIKTLDPVPVSLMPVGLDQALSEQELVDLVAYLSTLK